MSATSRTGVGRATRLTPLLLLLPALIVIGFLVIWPVLNNVIQSFTVQDGGIGAYQWLVENPIYLQILGRTLLVAAIVTAICIIVGYPYAYMIATSGPRVKALLMAIAILPMWISLLVRVFAWFILLQRNGPISFFAGIFGYDGPLLGSPVAVCVAMAQLLLPFFLLPLVTRMNTIDPRLLSAAQSLGAKPPRAFTRVFLPLSIPGVVTGGVTVFILSLGFFLAPALLGSPSDSLLAQTIFQPVSEQLNFGRGGALATVLICSMILIALLMLLLRRITQRQTGGKR